MIGFLISAMAIFLVATFPATWLLMLFLGNIGVDASYWARSRWESSCRRSWRGGSRSGRE